MAKINKNRIITIYLFGNPLLPFDNLPLKLLPKLKKQFAKINFVVLDPNENLKPLNDELIIIDTVLDINKVTVCQDLDKIQLNKIYSPHDLDLGFNLKLLQKIGRLKKITIFGVPADVEQQKVFSQLVKLIEQTIKAN